MLIDAANEEAIHRLRQRKQRDEEPFAVMFPSLEAARASAELGDEEERALLSSEAPILLVRRRPDARLAEGVAPGNPLLGVMLPYTPLHHLLLSLVDRPVVCTSGNLCQEPKHNALVELGATLASRAAIRDVALTGGCFQNALLARGLGERLEAQGYRVHEPLAVPRNDGSVALRQVYVAARALCDG